MRVMVFFDLPVETSFERKQYAKFRKFLLNDGFIMMQKSVYSKITINGPSSDAVIKNVYKHTPSNGIVQILKITEKQFQSIEYIIGESQKEIVDSQQRFVIL